MKKNIIILLSVISCLAFQACDKESYGDLYGGGISESIPSYVEISSKATLTVIEGNSATIQLRVRNAFTKPVTINYDVSGAFAKTGSVIIPANTLTVNAVVAVPVNLLTANDSKTAVFKILSATADGKPLKIGLTTADLEKRSIKIVGNVVSFAGDSVLNITEALQDTTVKIPLHFGKKLEASTSISYTMLPIEGNTGNDLVLITSNPIVIPAGIADTTISINLKANTSLNDKNKYQLKLTTVVSVSGSKVFINDATNSRIISVKDDLKKVNFKLSNTPLDITVAGNRTFEVNLSGASKNSVTTTYTITGGIAGVDYIDRTLGLINFPAGSTISNINLEIPTTYTVGKTLSIKLNNVTSTDAEVSSGTKNEIILKLK